VLGIVEALLAVKELTGLKGRIMKGAVAPTLYGVWRNASRVRARSAQTLKRLGGDTVPF
jgi:hypothetical protein